MSENGRNNQAPLKIPAAKAVSQLQNCEEKGEKLYHLLNDLYNSRRERPIRKNTIDSFKAKLDLWIEQTARIIKDIYADETYIRNFGTNLIDDEWFNLTSTKLRENMFNSRKELTQLQYEWDSADTKQKKHLKMKILKDIGPIKHHWEYEKGRMISHLEEFAKSKSEYLTSRIIYLIAFGSRPRLVGLEFPTHSAAAQIKMLLSKEPFVCSVSTADDRFRVTWDKIKNGKMGLKDAFRDTDVKTLLSPQKLIFDLEKRTLLLVPPIGKGILTDTFSGMGWDHKKHAEIWNKIGFIKADYEDEFKRAILKPVSSYVADWASLPPKYDKNDIRGSFESLGIYLIELEYLIKSIPNILLLHPDLSRFKAHDKYKNIEIDGINYNLTVQQSKILKLMHSRAINGENTALAGGTILQKANLYSKTARLGNIFRNHPAKTLLLKDDKNRWLFNSEYL